MSSTESMCMLHSLQGQVMKYSSQKKTLTDTHNAVILTHATAHKILFLHSSIHEACAQEVCSRVQCEHVHDLDKQPNQLET